MTEEKEEVEEEEKNPRKKKRSKKLYGIKEINMVSDLMISFIGFCIIILAVISLTGMVPKEYTFGATLAGFWFVFSDVLLIDDKLRLRDLLFYMFLMFMGIFSFIVIPVIVRIFPLMGETLMSNSDFFTFMALGAVLATMGVKTILRKKDQTTTKIELLESELEQLKQRNEEIKSSLDEVQDKLIETETLLREINNNTK